MSLSCLNSTGKPKRISRPPSIANAARTMPDGQNRHCCKIDRGFTFAKEFPACKNRELRKMIVRDSACRREGRDGGGNLPSVCAAITMQSYGQGCQMAKANILGKNTWILYFLIFFMPCACICAGYCHKVQGICNVISGNPDQSLHHQLAAYRAKIKPNLVARRGRTRQ